MKTVKTGRELIVGQLNSVFLRAVEILDPDFSRVAALGGVHEVRITEVWLLPSHDAVITESFLGGASFNTIEEFLELCEGHPGDAASGFARTLRHKLLAHYFMRLSHDDTKWHMRVREVEGGQVISVIFGHRILMNRAQAEGYVPQ